MTPDQLAAIRARLDAATPGPWEVIRYNDDAGGSDPTVPRFFVAFTPQAMPDGGSGRGDTTWLGANDAELIAHAPTDLADLLAYVGQLEGLLRDLCEDSRAAAEVVRLRNVMNSVAHDIEGHAVEMANAGEPADALLSMMHVKALREAVTPVKR